MHALRFLSPSIAILVNREGQKMKWVNRIKVLEELRSDGVCISVDFEGLAC